MEKLNYKLKRLLFILFVMIFAIMFLFSVTIASYLRGITKENLETVSAHIISELTTEFAQIERAAFSLEHNAVVNNFVTEPDIKRYYLLAAEVEQQLLASKINANFVDNVIVFNQDGDFYRFTGTISNHSCKRAYHILSQRELPSHVSIRLDERSYIGYVSSVMDAKEQTVGMVLMLIDEDKILSTFRKYDREDYLHITIKADNVSIMSSAQPSEAESALMISKNVSLSPFQIIVSSDNRYIRAPLAYFLIASAVTICAFAIALYSFAKTINVSFLGPMFRVIHSIENLDLSIMPTTLSNQEINEFDLLIRKINEMLQKLYEKSEAVRLSELRMKNTEIERQKSTIESLKKQINAHFTINALSSISILIAQTNPQKAQTISDGLIHIVRYAYAEDDFISLSEEFKMIESYLAILNARYEYDLTVTLDLDDRLIAYKVPRMLLQPLAENSMFYAFTEHEAGSTITLSAKQAGQVIFLSFSDNGSGMEDAQLRHVQQTLCSDSRSDMHGVDNIGLFNINRRLTAYFGDAYSFAVSSQPGVGTCVQICLPYQEEQQHDY